MSEKDSRKAFYFWGRYFLLVSGKQEGNNARVKLKHIRSGVTVEVNLKPDDFGQTDDLGRVYQISNKKKQEEIVAKLMKSRWFRFHNWWSFHIFDGVKGEEAPKWVRPKGYRK